MSNSSTETPLPHPLVTADELGPLVGRHFGGYEITSYIGEGATGAVYRAEDLMGGRMAVKVMHSELSRKDAAEQLWADLKKLAALGSPHFVRVFDSGVGSEGEFFYAMDELRGADLEAGLEESGALAPRKALEIVRQVCDTLEAAHAAGVIHGGLKPRNVFLEPEDGKLTVKVLDFGAARMAGGVDKGVIVGNPFYMAPEQFGGTADARTDIYALGVLMYELFSGTLPFAGPSHGQVMMRHLAEVPAPPPGVDPELGRIILRALVKVPAGRYGSVKQLRDAIERWVQTRPALLADAAEMHVVARAQEARALKQRAAASPDATVPMPKLDMQELARATQMEATPAPPGKPENDKDESVEASLEDFISQANASFPTSVTSDGWDLHTGDVELIDEAQAQLEAPPKPAQQKPTSKPTPKVTQPGFPAVEAKPPTPPKKPAPAPMAPPPEDPEVAAAGAALGDEAEDEVIEPALPSRPVRKIERTEIVSAPLPQAPAMPWTANPLVIIGGLLAAFVIGAGLVFLMVRTMMPTTQPVVVQAPPPAYAIPAPSPTVTPLAPAAHAQPAAVAQPVAAQPAAPAQPAAVAQPAPVAAVPTPAAPPAAAQPSQPIVTPLTPPTAAAPAVAEAPERRRAPVRVKHPVRREAPAPRREPERAAAPKPAPAPVAKKEPPPKPAPKSAPAKKESKGSDWVDPFAQ